MLVVMSVILGLYWAVGATLQLSLVRNYPMAQASVWHTSRCSELLSTHGLPRNSLEKRKMVKKLRKLMMIELPGFMSIFNDNMVCTSILMLIFFGAILVILGRDYLTEQGFMTEGQSMVFYVIQTCLYFSVYLAILQLGVRTFCNRADTVLPGYYR